MHAIFYWIYEFSKKFKIFFGGLLLLYVAMAMSSILQLKTSEDIFDIVPKNKTIEEAAAIMDAHSVNSRIFLHFYVATKDSVSVDSLVKHANVFADTLWAHHPKTIVSFQKEVGEDRIFKLFDYYYRNLPFYLEEDDYLTFKNKTNKKAIDTALLSVVKSMMNPVSGVTKDFKLKDPLGLTHPVLQRASSLQLDENISLYRGHLCTKDRRHLLMFLELDPDTEAAGLLKNLRKKQKDFNKKGGHFAVDYFGAPAVAQANAKRVRYDVILTVSLAVLFLFILIFGYYKRLRIFPIVLAPGLFGALTALAIMATFRTEVSVISLAVGSVLLGITIDYALHFFTHYKNVTDIRQLFKDLTTPLLLSSFTTCCAFLSLLFISSKALQDLGIFASISVISAAVFTLLTVPHGLVKPRKNAKPNKVEKALNWMAEYPIHRNRKVLLGVLVVTVLSLFTWRNYHFESNVMELNYMPKGLQQAQDNLNKVTNLSQKTVYLAATGKTTMEALEKMSMVDADLAQMKKEGLLLNYISASQVVPPPKLQAQRLNYWNDYFDPETKRNILSELNKGAGIIGFKPDAFQDFEATLTDLHHEISPQDVLSINALFADGIIVRKGEKVAVISTLKIAEDQRKAVFEQLAELEVIIVLDKGFLAEQMLGVLQFDFTRFVNISLLVVFIFLLLVYGRIELAVLVVLPILLSWLWVLGLMGLFGLEFNIVNVIICTFIFGLGVDYSIFIMQGSIQRYAFDLKNLNSYKRSILVSTFTTLVGIGVLIFARHPALNSIAPLAIIGIIGAILLTFTVQVLLFNYLALRRKKKGVIPYTLGTTLRTLHAFLWFLMGCGIVNLYRMWLQMRGVKSVRKKERYHKAIQVFNNFTIRFGVGKQLAVQDKEKADYTQPSVIICNHQSFIDIPLHLRMHHKLIIIANHWVYHSPLFGKLVQYGDFVLATESLEKNIDKLQELVKEGYSIIVFPEGTRSTSFDIKRFHKGAFYMAEKLGLDIQPVLFHGMNMVLSKGDDFYLKGNTVTMRYLNRIDKDDLSYGATYSDRAKSISKMMKNTYLAMREELETPEFFKEIVTKNYLYKGPVLEWYVKIKLKLENYYTDFHDLLPKKGKIVDLGCGNGMMAYSLAFAAPERQIYGVDYDSHKIQIAEHCPVKPTNLSFDYRDVMKCTYNEVDAVILSDVIHYLEPDEQKELLDTIYERLLVGGKLLLRDGDSEAKDRHKSTLWTEKLSTQIVRFNKTRNDLHFISRKQIEEFAQSKGMDIQVIDHSKRTSNLLFCLTK